MTVITSKTAELRKLFIELGIDRNKATKIISSGTSLQHEFDVNAEDFLQPWFALASILSFVAIVFLGMLLAALQSEREERKKTRGNESRPPE